MEIDCEIKDVILAIINKLENENSLDILQNNYKSNDSENETFYFDECNAFLEQV